MKFSGNYLYRVRITSYPQGAFEPVGPIDSEHPEDAVWEPVPGWAPAGWRPEGRYVEIMGTSEFVWPVTSHVYGSRSTAKKRADLLESYGATAVVEQSSRIEWPETAESERDVEPVNEFPVDSEVFHLDGGRPQVHAILSAVNAVRADADERFAADFRDAHACCEAGE